MKLILLVSMPCEISLSRSWLMPGAKLVNKNTVICFQIEDIFMQYKCYKMKGKGLESLYVRSFWKSKFILFRNLPSKNKFPPILKPSSC